VSLAKGPRPGPKVGQQLSTGGQFIIAAACGLLIANIYYAQPLTRLIAGALGLPPQLRGLLVTAPLAGYGLGLLLIVPLGDLAENRRLVLLLTAAEGLCLLGLSLIAQPAPFLAVAFATGLFASAVQILVPYVTYLMPEAVRGRALGRAVSGVMLGIMLARPFSSAVAQLSAWRVAFGLAAGFMAVLVGVLGLTLPPRRPAPGLTYAALLRSMARLLRDNEILRRRGLYHASMFGAFSVFWTSAPVWLTGAPFHLSQGGVAWVALAGVAGALAPPLAGRIADRGPTLRPAAAAMAAAVMAFLISDLARDGSALAIGAVVVAAVLLDFAVSAHLVFGQRAIYGLGAETRSRLNGLYFAIFFAGGAAASALSGMLFPRLGWPGVSTLGIALPLLSLAYLAGDRTKT
jgi:predicted MFS family arabinose efflux permease